MNGVHKGYLTWHGNFTAVVQLRMSERDKEGGGEGRRERRREISTDASISCANLWNVKSKCSM